MKTKLFFISVVAFGLLGLTSCGSVKKGAPHYVPVNHGKNGLVLVPR